MKDAHRAIGTDERRGAVMALPIVVLIISLLAPVLIARHMQGSHTRDNVGRATRGMILLDIGRAALTEAWWRLEQAAANSADPRFITLREPSASRRELRFQVPHTSGYLGVDPVMGGFSVAGDEVKAVVGATVPISGHPLEGSHDVVLSVTVKHSHTGLVRTLRERRELRRTLLTAPVPYDRHALVILSAGGLVGDRANTLMEESIQALTRISAALAKNGSKLQLADGLGGFKDAPPPLSDDLTTSLHRFPSRLAITLRGNVDELARLNLGALLEAKKRAIDALGPPPDPNANPSSEGEAKRLIEQAKQHALAHDALLKEASRWQDAYEEYGDSKAEEFASYNSSSMTPEAWKKRATFRFEGKGATRRMLSVLDSYKAEGRPVSGVFYLDNRTEPLAISQRTFHGRVLIVATGDVSVADLSLSDRRADLLVVQAEGKLTSSGRIEGVLIGRGGVNLTADTQVRGGIVVDQVRIGDLYAGKLVSDIPRIEATVDGKSRPEMLWLTLCPWADLREVETR